MYVWANSLRRIEKPSFEQPFETIETPPGATNISFFELAWSRVKPWVVGEKVALIAPGLNGGAYARPTRGMVRALNEEGWDVAVWVYRDTGESKTSVRRTYSGYAFDDLKIAVDRLAHDYTNIALVGLSLGGNIVLQYVCEVPDSKVSKAVAISPPIDFGASVQFWSQSVMGRFVISALAKREMKSKTKAKRQSQPATVNESDVAAYDNVRSVAAADHFITSEFNGYMGASDYWYAASTTRALRNLEIITDTLIISAKDDFLLDSKSYPVEDAIAPMVTMELPANGSHIGFVPRGWPRHRYWSEQRTLDHIS
jgi:predicted alpha/beta-fold hydrolase